ncbi:MAG: hypothetical protein RIE73_04100 [Coleofasciculus sp. C1-SOL-03]|jgi:hypothetical protein|uniref:hypothetical protein n=1 Tax=Coleofasciculus sp. C1-SOL-03 TaxID=3069522 RepID=UPI0032F24512
MANQNFRVVGYISPVTYSKLKEFMEAQALTEAEAIDKILSTYLGTTPLPKPANGFETKGSSITAESSPPVSPSAIPKDKSLTQNQLAERLKCDTRKLTDIRGYPVVLSDYTRTRDPQGIAWEYEAEFDRYFPLEQ